MVLKNRDRCTLKKVNTRLTEDVGGNICMLGRGEAAWKCRGLPTPTIFLQISAKSLFRIVLQWSRPQRAMKQTPAAFSAGFTPDARD